MDENALQLLGSRIRERRLALGVSQEKFAQIAGLHRTYIWQIESGKHNIAVTNLLKIARALGTKASDLLEGIE